MKVAMILQSYFNVLSKVGLIFPYYISILASTSSMKRDRGKLCKQNNPLNIVLNPLAQRSNFNILPVAFQFIRMRPQPDVAGNRVDSKDPVTGPGLDTVPYKSIFSEVQVLSQNFSNHSLTGGIQRNREGVMIS